MVLGKTPRNTDDCDCRCPCGRLLARRQQSALSVRCPRCKRTLALAEPVPDEARCVCGKLIARRAEAEVELRCPRCKRFVNVALSDDEALRTQS